MLGAVHGANVDELQIEPGFTIDTDDRELALLRIVHEALRDAVRHAHAERVRPCASGPPTAGLVVEVADDGVGFDPDSAELRAGASASPGWRNTPGELRGQAEESIRGPGPAPPSGSS